MYSPCDNAALPALGFPIRESTGQRLFNTSPWLIAVVHALLRLLVPRHPPCALDILTVIDRRARELGRTMKPNFFNWPAVQFSRSGEKRKPRHMAAAGLSKLSSADLETRPPDSVDIPRTAGALTRRRDPEVSLERR